MKNKMLLWIIAAAALLLALLLGGLPLLSRLYYHRSQAATLFAWQLKKEKYTTAEAFEAYLAEKREENNSDYAVPEEIAAEISIVQDRPAGMQFFLLGGSDDGAPSPDAPVIFYFPGGSYIDQPREVHWRFLDALAQNTGALVVVPIYPKLPDSDAGTACAALTAAYEEFISGMVHGDLIFMGDSAGGGLALSFAMQLRDAGLEGPEKLILICPWLDVTLTNPDIPAYEKRDPCLDSEQLRHLGALWAGDLSPAAPIVSPLNGSFDGLGAITLITGTGELLYPDIMALHDELSRQGIAHDLASWEGMFHVFPLYLGYGIPETEEAYDQIVSAVLR